MGLWRSTERGEKTPEIDDALGALNDDIYRIFTEAPELMPTSFALFSNVMKYRSYRIQDSARHMPHILKNTLQYAAFLLIFLSMFIGIKNIWLAFLFTASIASLAFSIFTVLLDLDNPLKPGSWHITTKDYEDLLARIDARKKEQCSDEYPCHRNKLRRDRDRPPHGQREASVRRDFPLLRIWSLRRYPSIAHSAASCRISQNANI